MVTKEEVEKARADYYDAENAAEAADRAVHNSWHHYQKLKEAFENGKG